MTVHTKVLVVANVTAASDDLIDALQARAERGAVTFTLLMPAQQIGAAGRDAAQARVGEALEKWHAAGLEATGILGDADPVEAVQEAWDPRSYDEVIVSTLPGQTSKWVRADLPHRVARITDAQVTHVVARDRATVQGEPPAPKEKATLGPLSVLSWGGRRR
jgi:hypothetical protein